MGATKEECIKVEMEEELSEETKIEHLYRQLEQLVEDAKILVNKAVEVSHLILISEAELKSDKNVQSLSSFLTNSLDLLKSTHSTIKSINNGKGANNLKMGHTLPVSDSSYKTVKLEPDKIMDMKMYELENNEQTNFDFGNGDDYYSSNEELNSDKETTIKEELKSKPLKPQKKKSTKIRKAKKSSKFALKNIKTDSEDRKTVIVENMKINSSELKQYQCHRCNYSTNSEIYFKDHMAGTLKFKQCLWCDEHVPITSKRGDVHLNKHMNTLHNGNYGAGSDNQCLHCKETFKTINHLLNHLKTEHSRNILFHCAEEGCDYSCVVSSHIHKHSERQHIDSSLEMIQCDQCEFSSKSKERVNHHIYYTHNEYECSTCSKKFIGKGELQKHQRNDHGFKTERKEESLCCDVCGQVVSNKRTLRDHKESAHSNIRVKCTECDFTTTGNRQLRKHMKRWHTTELPYPCDLCQDRFSTLADITLHMENIHGGQKYRCDQCEFNTANKYGLEKHVKIKHTREGLFSCVECDSKFAFERDLKRHKKFHEVGAEKCPIEGCEFTCFTHYERKKMEIHIKAVHEGVRHHCGECDFTGRYKSDLNRHIKVVHKGFIVRCNECPFTATKQCVLKAHVMKVHEGVTWPCSDCDYVGNTRDKLSFHVRAIHKGIQHTCDLCNYKSPHKRNVTRHKELIHKIFDTKDNILQPEVSPQQ